MLNPAESLLAFSTGACAYLAVLRIWLRLDDRSPSRWAAAWAIAAFAFSTARLVQLTATDPATALLAAHSAAAATPFLLWTLYVLVGSVTDYRPHPAESRGALGVAIASALAAQFTPLFVLPELELRPDLAGEPYLAALPGPGLWLLGLESAAAIVWCLGRVLWTTALSGAEKRVFGAALSVYAAMGLSSLAPALGVVRGEGVLEYGPLVVTIGISRLIAMRQRRLEVQLEEQAADGVRARRASEELLRRVVEEAPIGFLTVDTHGHLDHANQALLAMLGSTRSQFQVAFNVANEENARRSGFSEMFHRALTSGEVLTAEFEFDTWWNRRLHTRTTVSPYRDAAGAVAGALAIVEDITEQRAIERGLRRTQRLEAVGQLAAGIAHEINNPMAYVRSNLAFLEEEFSALEKELAGDDSAPHDEARARLRALKEHRTRALAGVQRTVAVVRDLREFSRAGSGAREAVDVNVELQHAVRLASTRVDGLGEIALQLESVSPVAFDASQLRQVLLNLLTHAQLAAGATGRVRASTSEADGHIRITVHDDGPPIRPEERERLFHPFAMSRGDSEPTLGLYVSLQIVREHDGTLDVQSSAKHGTSFVVRLPVLRNDSDPPENAAAPR